MSALVAWLLAYMLAVSPPAQAVKFRGEIDEAHVITRYRSVAEDVAGVALDPSERLRDPTSTALALAASALCESAFDWRVDSGHCTPGTCDGGLAWSMWQIHDGGGIALDGPRFTYARAHSPAWVDEHFREIANGPALIRDRKLAVRFALHMRRVSVQLWSTWRCSRDSAAWWRARRAAP